MKKGIAIIILITLSLILFKPPKISAASNYGYSPGWSQNLPNLGRVDYKECTSSTECTALKPVNSYPGYNGNNEREYIVNDTWNMQIGKNGYVLNSPVGTLKKDYLYNIEFYICGNKQLGQEVEIYATNYDEAYNKSNIYNEMTRTNLSPEAFLDTELNMNSCYLYSGLVVPEKNYTWAGLRIRSTDSIITNVIIPTIAVNVRELGMYSNSLENIIQNSGFASAESVEQVQDSVNRVEEAITGDYDYNDTPSEELEGKEDLDNLKEKEEELLGNLDFSGADNLEITIEPESASFIWQIVDALRSMSGKIVLLITSILGLGIIKMILNR